ncbi:hypothetical protein MMC12_004293 [Toensbergia leucococca]|nr:hypothetical protein [Toensbergia leucococca]
MFPSIKIVNDRSSDHRPGGNRISRSKKSKLIVEKVGCSPSMSSPARDWILFPEDATLDSERPSGDVTLQLSLLTVTSPRVGTAPSPLRGPSASIIKNASTRLDNQEGSYHSADSDRKASADTVDDGQVEKFLTLPRTPLPQRLPTPELDDIDRDAFWSCCGASANR